MRPACVMRGAEVFNGVIWRCEWNGIPQMFTARKYTNGATIGLRDPITIKFFFTEPSSLEVEVIENSPFDTSSCEVSCHLNPRLFQQPTSRRLWSEDAVRANGCTDESGQLDPAMATWRVSVQRIHHQQFQFVLLQLRKLSGRNIQDGLSRAIQQVTHLCVKQSE